MFGVISFAVSANATSKYLFDRRKLARQVSSNFVGVSCSRQAVKESEVGDGNERHHEIFTEWISSFADAVGFGKLHVVFSRGVGTTIRLGVKASAYIANYHAALRLELATPSVCGPHPIPEYLVQ